METFEQAVKFILELVASLVVIYVAFKVGQLFEALRAAIIEDQEESVDWAGPKSRLTSDVPTPKCQKCRYAGSSAAAREFCGCQAKHEGACKPTRILTPIDDTGEISDGDHTFNDLYEHRNHLFLALALAHKDAAFRTKKESGGGEINGWFILGLNTKHGQITYHLPMSMWILADGIAEIERNVTYDGHTSKDVVERLRLIAVSGV